MIAYGPGDCCCAWCAFPTVFWRVDLCYWWRELRRPCRIFRTTRLACSRIVLLLLFVALACGRCRLTDVELGRKIGIGETLDGVAALDIIHDVVPAHL